MSSSSWWEKYFPPDVLHANKLPNYELADRFWEDYFPPMLFCTKSIYNSDQFWRKVQRVIETITGDTLPCPFTQVNKFIDYLYVNNGKITMSSREVCLKFLDMIPSHSDSIGKLLLWYLPDWIGDEIQYFQLLLEFALKENQLWRDFIEVDGIIDVALDKFIPMLKCKSEKQSEKSVELTISISSFVVELITAKPGNISSFSTAVSKFINKLLNHITNSCSTIAFYSTKNCCDLLERLQFCFSDSQFKAYATKLIDCLMNSSYRGRYGIMRLFKISNDELKVSICCKLLKNAASAEDVELSVENIKKCNKSSVIPFVQELLHFSVTNKAFSRVALLYLRDVLMFSGDFPWIHAFIKRTGKFVAISVFSGYFMRRVKMIIDFYHTLYDTHIMWVQKTVSEVSGLLLATQKIPMAFLSKLKPDPLTNKKLVSDTMKPYTKSSAKQLITFGSYEEVIKPTPPKNKLPNVLSKSNIQNRSSKKQVAIVPQVKNKISRPVAYYRKSDNPRNCQNRAPRRKLVHQY